jgi:hypothetical protein
VEFLFLVSEIKVLRHYDILWWDSLLLLACSLFVATEVCKKRQCSLNSSVTCRQI